MFCRHTARAPITSGTVTFLRCYADTQLALKVQQERTQVVCGNKEAQKRLTDHSNPLPQLTLDSEPIMFVGIVVCACSRHALGLKMLFFRSFVSRKGFCVISVTEVLVVLFSPPFFLFVVMPPHSWHSKYSRNGHRWCAVIRKPASASLNRTVLPQWTLYT